jgi:hypothetical protein
MKFVKRDRTEMMQDPFGRTVHRIERRPVTLERVGQVKSDRVERSL